MSSVGTVEKGINTRPRRVADVDKRRDETSFGSSHGPVGWAVSQLIYVPKGDVYNLRISNFSFFAKALKNNTFPISVLTPRRADWSSIFQLLFLSRSTVPQNKAVYIIWSHVPWWKNNSLPLKLD